MRRLLIEILIIGGLIYLGWEQPFKTRLEQVQAAVRATTPSKVKPAVPQESAAPAVPPATTTPIP
jgi:hypothetical protein